MVTKRASTEARHGTSEVASHALFAHRFFLRTGLAIGNVFAWVFVFEYFWFVSGDPGRALAATALLYALAQLIIVIATPVSAAHLRYGSKRSLVWGVLLAAGAFVYLGATLGGFFSPQSGPAGWGFVAFAVLLGAYRALYWVPYTLTEAETRPHQHMRVYLEVFIALMPLFAGLTLATLAFGYMHVLFGAAVLIALAALPALFLKNIRERFSWPYAYTFAQLFRSKNQGFVLHSLFEGLQGAALFLAWPIAIFVILERSYADLGLVFTLTLLFILLVRRAYGWFRERSGLSRSGAVQGVLMMSGWVARIAAGTPVGVIMADSFFYTVAPRRGVQADPFSFEQVGDRGAFLDEYTVLKEMGLALGRIMLCLVLFFFAPILPLPFVLAIVLAIAALASGVSAVLSHRLPVAAY